jgi:hypothetical protein
MLERLLDRDHNHRRGLLAIDGETPPEDRVGADPGAPVDPIGLVRSGDEKDQPEAGILDEVLEAVEAIVAARGQGSTRSGRILDLDETGRRPWANNRSPRLPPVARIRNGDAAIKARPAAST